MLRWLLPLFAALSLVGSSVTAWAAAGFIGESACCCPDKTKCKCHDHDNDKGHHDAEMNRCAGTADFVPPGVTPAVDPVAAPLTILVQADAVATPMIEPIPEPRAIEIDTPPF